MIKVNLKKIHTEIIQMTINLKNLKNLLINMGIIQIKSWMLLMSAILKI